VLGDRGPDAPYAPLSQACPMPVIDGFAAHWVRLTSPRGREPAAAAS
jgi:hypothetical protein